MIRYFALGVAVALPVWLTLRLARLHLAELHHLDRVILEMKRRMSVAKTASGEAVSFAAGGDPEGYGAAASAHAGDGDVLEFLVAGRKGGA